VKRVSYLDEIERALEPFLSAPTRRAILTCAARAEQGAGPAARLAVLRELRRGVETFARGSETVRQCLRVIDRFDPPGQIVSVVDLRREQDVRAVHTAVRSFCAALGFSSFAMTRVTTATMEIVRNALCYAGGGTLRIATLAPPDKGIEVVVSDGGSGIANLEEILSGRYRSRTGMGAGLRGAKAMADVFEVDTSRAGTTVRLRKYLS
jgi:serine/threonine-protein kinase RsbT